MAAWVVLHIVGAYLLGSISSAVLITRLFSHSDIRTQGSRNPGATNVLRVAGKKAAAAVFLFDVLKGALPVYLGFLLGYTPITLSVIAVAACIGHMYPIFFSFAGGKGVATALGAILPLNAWLAVRAWHLGSGICGRSRISSLAAIVTLILAPVYTYIFKPEYTVAVAILCALIIIKHKANIMRLVRKQEATLRQYTKRK